jgi:hypothetical protein
MSGDIFGCHNYEMLPPASNGQGSEMLLQPIMHGTVPTTKNYLAPNVNSVELGKLLKCKMVTWYW